MSDTNFSVSCTILAEQISSTSASVSFELCVYTETSVKHNIHITSDDLLKCISNATASESVRLICSSDDYKQLTSYISLLYEFLEDEVSSILDELSAASKETQDHPESIFPLRSSFQVPLFELPTRTDKEITKASHFLVLSLALRNRCQATRLIQELENLATETLLSRRKGMKTRTSRRL